MTRRHEQRDRGAGENRVSNNESFIDEVNDEVRRDRLYGALRRYGWLGVVAVLLIVGGTAWTQFSSAQARGAAEARGDALLAAMDNEAPEARAEALATVPSDGPAAVVTLFLEAAAQLEAEDRAGAIATLDALAANPDVQPLYQELARLKALMIDTGDPAARAEALSNLAQPGAPFRLLALEQQALAQIAAGDPAAALETLGALLEDAAVTGGLRDRASALIVSLGGDLPGEASAPPAPLD